MGFASRPKAELERSIDALADELSRADARTRKELLGRLSAEMGSRLRPAPVDRTPQMAAAEPVDDDEDELEARFDNLPV